jgi:hypothetical protein
MYSACLDPLRYRLPLPRAHWPRGDGRHVNVVVGKRWKLGKLWVQMCPKVVAGYLASARC